METNLQIDNALIAKAARLGGHSTKKAAVTQALVEYIRHLEQQKVTSLFGAMHLDPTYNYTKQRARS